MATPSSITPSPYNDAEELRRFLDSYDPEGSDKERLVLFKDKDGQVHIIGKKINQFEGLWAKLGLSNRMLRGFGMADCNIKHVLEFLNEKKLHDPRLKKIVDRYNAKKRKSQKIHEEDFPHLFPEI
jgi:hypothetical protein